MNYKKVFFLFLLVGCSVLGMDNSKKQKINPTINLKKIGKQINNVNKLGVIKFGQAKINLKKLLVEEPWINKFACIKSLYKYIGSQDKIPTTKEVRTIFSSCLRYFNGNDRLMMKDVHDLAFVVAKNSDEAGWNFEISKKVALRSAQFLAQKELNRYDTPFWNYTVKYGSTAFFTLFAFALRSYIPSAIETNIGKIPIDFIAAGIAGLGSIGVMWAANMYRKSSLKAQAQVKILALDSKMLKKQLLLQEEFQEGNVAHHQNEKEEQL